MKNILIIPDINNIQETMELAEKYSLGFEYNDFFFPAVLDDQEKLNQLYEFYIKHTPPKFCTLHGAFFDVIPFSVDPKIREISALRIEQSIEAAEKIGAKAVVFHTNYNPFLNTPEYISSWIKQNVEFWSQVLNKHPQISIYLENMFDVSPDIMAELSEQLSCYDNYGICLDIAHASLTDVPLEVWVKTLGKYVKHIHINDNDLVSDLHLAWGDGKIDRQTFYRCYDEYMSGASVLIETTPLENKKRSLDILVKEGFILR